MEYILSTTDLIYVYARSKSFQEFLGPLSEQFMLTRFKIFGNYTFICSVYEPG
jgi:hypothetical protein